MIVKNEKKQVLIFPLRRYFLEATKERNRKKRFIFFSHNKESKVT